MKDPLKAAAWLTPRASPRCPAGKASVRMAAELAINMAAPTAWKMRMVMSQIPAACPWVQVMVSSREKRVKTAKPRL